MALTLPELPYDHAALEPTPFRLQNVIPHCIRVTG